MELTAKWEDRELCNQANLSLIPDSEIRYVVDLVYVIQSFASVFFLFNCKMGIIFFISITIKIKIVFLSYQIDQKDKKIDTMQYWQGYGDQALSPTGGRTLYLHIIQIIWQ